MYTDEYCAAFNRPAPLVKRKPDILLNEGEISLVLHWKCRTPGHAAVVSAR
jgi:hypothetical protein